VPEQASHFRRALLAYDGSTHSKEALFMATYLAETWQTELTVVTALKGARQKTDVQDHVQRYLDIHEVQAKYIVTKFESMNFLNTTAEELQVDLILMGGDQSSPLQNVISGNLLDYTLRESKVPTFVCH
jgi:nucleotide-binding universal stress UspA family protein